MKHSIFLVHLILPNFPKNSIPFHSLFGTPTKYNFCMSFHYKIELFLQV